MKFKNIFAAAATAMLLTGGALTSCSDDILENIPNSDGTVTFTATIDDELETKAFGDGTSATKLRYAVYNNEDETCVATGTTTVSGRKASVTLKLIPSKTYDIAFFAYRSTSAYTFDKETGTITVNYDNMNISGSSLRYDDDCFFEVRKGYTAGSSSQETVTLTRPMAQVNFGTDDLESDVVKKAYTYGVYTGVTTTACKKLNLRTGEATDEEEITIPIKKPQTSSLGNFPVDGYTYLHTTYLLVSDPSPLRNITLNTSTYTNDPIKQTVSVDNAPTKRNYRTNIYGSLLTSTSGWKVTIEPIYSGTFDTWNGSVAEPKENADGEYIINTPEELAGLAKMVNDGNTFAGKTVKLNADLNLNNINWTPIGTDANPFNGTFDGQGHIICNLNVTLGSETKPAGLFGAVKTGGILKDFTIDTAKVNTLAASPAKYGTGVALGWIYTGKVVENVTVKNATVDAYRWVGGVVGCGYGSVNRCTAENVTVTAHFENLGDEWDNGDKAGAIIGLQTEGKYTLTDNKANNVNITGYRHIGGLFGMVNYGDASGNKTVTGNTITNSVVNQDLTHNYKNISAGDLAGEISGFYGANITENNNTATNVTVYLPSTVTNTEELKAAAAKGGIVTVDGDITLTEQITFTKPATLDLNGHTVTTSNPINTESELTIDGEGTLTSTGFAITGGSNSTIVINQGVIATTSTSEYQQAINTGGDLVMNGGKLVNSGNAPALSFNWANETTAHSAIFNGGEITANNDYALNIYAGKSSVKHQVTINGGTYIGTSGARADGNVLVNIKGGYFIQTSATATGHGFCAGAESYGSEGTEVIISAGYFYGNRGYAICRANQSKLTVNGAYLNKLNGGYTLGTGRSEHTIATPASVTIDGNTYQFGYQIR